MGAVEAVYVIQPYSHLEPLVEAAERLGLHLVYAKPSEVPRLIEALGSAYCGLTPLPLMLRHGLAVHPGPMVWVDSCSPSLVVLTPRGLDPLECRELIVTSESIATRTYAEVIAAVAGLALRTRAMSVEEAVEEARRGSCTLLIGDSGVRAWLYVDGVEVHEFIRVYARVRGLDRLAFAATAGPGCPALRGRLSRLLGLRPTLAAVLRVASRLRVPLPLAERYMRCTRLSWEPGVLEASIAELAALGRLATGASSVGARTPL